jgi:hypothetical protein
MFSRCQSEHSYAGCHIERGERYRRLATCGQDVLHRHCDVEVSFLDDEYLSRRLPEVCDLNRARVIRQLAEQGKANSSEAASSTSAHYPTSKRQR